MAEYCRARGIGASVWRMGPELDERGTKTEKTRIEIVGGGDDDRKIHRFVVWIFGIVRITEHPFVPDGEEGEAD